MILDEAHRGMRPKRSKNGDGRATIVQRLVNGHGDVPPMPIVWGISATIERFSTAMAEAQASEDRTTIVQRLVNGHDDVPPMPIVWGISATIERFINCDVRGSGKRISDHVLGGCDQAAGRAGVGSSQGDDRPRHPWRVG